MLFRRSALIVLLLSAAGPAAGQAKLADRPGFKDPTLFTRMPGFFLSYPDSVVEKPFDGFSFEVKGGRQRVESRYAHYKYRFAESTGPIPSALQIVRRQLIRARVCSIAKVRES